MTLFKNIRKAVKEFNSFEGRAILYYNSNSHTVFVKKFKPCEDSFIYTENYLLVLETKENGLRQTSFESIYNQIRYILDNEYPD